MNKFHASILCLSALVLASCSEGPKPRPYPLKTCAVSGEKLGTMGKPAVVVVNGQEVQFCCKECIKDFNKDPDKFLKEIAGNAPAQ